MTNPFTPAVKHRHFLRMALVGPAGTGKTYTALRLAQGLGARIAVVDTEHDSASLYAPLFAFDVLPLGSFAPQAYLDAIAAARTYGYDVLILDSLSHAWAGKDGILERQAKAAGPDQWGNDRLAWRGDLRTQRVDRGHYAGAVACPRDIAVPRGLCGRDRRAGQSHRAESRVAPHSARRAGV